MSQANKRQVGGTHYKNRIQHWDWVSSNGLDYFQGQITKYVARWKYKNGIEDLEKAQHFLEKYIELERTKKRNENQGCLNLVEPTKVEIESGAVPLARGYVDQDY